MENMIDSRCLSTVQANAGIVQISQTVGVANSMHGHAKLRTSVV